jgi:6-pyruvoyl-tetrahydropterin synthase-like protein
VLPANNPTRDVTTRGELAPVLLIIATATLVTLPLFANGLPHGEDSVKHYRWTTEFAQALKCGELYPRWFAGSNQGLGSPLPIFYPPLPFYVASVFGLITGNIVTGISIGCWVALSFSGIFMYLLARLALPSWPSTLAAAMYILLPYHVLDIYSSSAISELWGFVWIPLILLGICSVMERGWKGVTLVSISYAALLQTHLPSAFITSLSLPFFCLAVTRDLKRLTKTAAGLLLGAGLSAVFILPVVLERKYIQLQRLLDRVDYKRAFLFEHLSSAVNMLFHPPTGPDSPLQDELAAAGMVLLVLIALFAVWRAYRARRSILTSSELSTGLVTLTVLGLLMSTRLTVRIWKIAPGFKALGFPARWLQISAIGCAFAVGAAFVLIKTATRYRPLWWSALALIVSLNVLLAGAVILRAPYNPEPFSRALGRRETPEYRPIWWNDEIPEHFANAPAVVTSGAAEVLSSVGGCTTRRYQVQATTETVLVFGLLYFPGWVANIDGVQAPTEPNEDGFVQLAVGAGEHSVVLSFEDTWPRRVGKWTSLLSLAFLLCALLAVRRGKAEAASSG